MSLVKTLGKMALGIVVAKGMGRMMGGNSGGSSSGLGGLLGSLAGGGSSGGNLGGLLGSLAGGSSASSGGLGSLLGSLAGGGNQAGAGGLGGLLGSLAGGSNTGSAGGLGNLMGSLMGGGGNSGGGLGQLGSLLAGAGQQGGAAAGGLGGLLSSLGGSQSEAGPQFGNMFNQALQGQNLEREPSREEEQAAEILLRAMIEAAKCDGNIDREEFAKLTDHLGDVSPEEAAFVKQQMQTPANMQALVNDVPAGMEQQVYLMSLLGIDLDTKEEAVYLMELAKALNLSAETANQVHDQLGAPRLYQ